MSMSTTTEAQFKELLRNNIGVSYAKLVEDFMVKFGQATDPLVINIPDEHIELGKQLVDEEVLREFYPALEKFRQAQSLENAADLLDAIVDSVYVLLWTGLRCNLPVHLGFLEVHRSNMSKVWADGTVRYTEAGKVMKPPTYSPADLLGVMLHMRDLQTQHFTKGTRNG